MPTITIRNGNRTLKLTKRETQTLLDARSLCLDITEDFSPLKPDADNVRNGLRGILEYLTKTEGDANGKPADAGTAGK